MKAKTSPEVAVFKDKRLTIPISPKAETGFARFGNAVRFVARLDVKSSTLWVPPVVIPALLKVLER